MLEEILNIIQAAKKPISLSEIMGALAIQINERTLRRALNQLSTDHKIIKTGQKRGTRYSINLKNNRTSYFSEQSLKVLNIVHQPIFKRDPVGYQASFLETYEPNQSYYLEPNLREIFLEEGFREHVQPAGTYIKHIYNRFLIDLSYNSSRLEGNTYSILDTQRLILNGESAQGKLTEETIMILNHKEAIRYLVNNAESLTYSPDEMFTLHYLLSDGLVLNQYAGKIRDSAVRISASVYIPLESQNRLIYFFSEILDKARKIINPFEQSFFLLVQLSYLQPFIDVNKRTARLIANLPLIQHNLVPLSFNDVSKDDYISAMLAVYEKQDVAPLRDLYHFSYLRTCKLYNITMENIVNFDALRVQYRTFRRSAIKNIITQKLVGEALSNYLGEIMLEIPEEHRDKCKADILDDLKEIGPHRIAGLGITKEQLETWLAYCFK